MNLHEHDRTFVATLAAMGAVIGFGQLLTGGEKITARLIIGRMIVGAGLSVAASSILMLLPELSPIAVTGLGAALGILGQSYLELAVQRWLGKRSNHAE
ncbi:Putative Holin [Mycoavidus cysteinexigens]|uniref:Holin n=1 Tax=Mycoavidus cysteinexigens TaxID=1553431 RepID=A0A2Z6EVK1_9BURK|nr:holin [Mycoavidus cysteinexigens]BBE09477.1 Putative Holin [Mycoavidus cysteinexigens]GLR01299.1 holin [Mycoavidus cysteinexigens]